MLQQVANERRIAINIRADLQHRRAPVAAGERHQLGLGHGARDDDRLPSLFFVAENQADFFGKRRAGVMMKDQIGHGGTFRTGFKMRQHLLVLR
jgi:hypothetical protein